MLKDCKELVESMPEQNSYEYPKELLSLQGKQKIFQLHFDPESTKERKIFILDTCWDDTPLLTSGSAIGSESTVESTAATMSASQPEEDEAVNLQQLHMAEIAKEPLTTMDELKTATPPKEVAQFAEVAGTEPKTPPDQSSLPETSKLKNQPSRKSARKGIFTEKEDGSAASGSKKSKKEE